MELAEISANAMIDEISRKRDAKAVQIIDSDLNQCLALMEEASKLLQSTVVPFSYKQNWITTLDAKLHEVEEKCINGPKCPRCGDYEMPIQEDDTFVRCRRCKYLW
jgi:hypothetical protein